MIKDGFRLMIPTGKNRKRFDAEDEEYLLVEIKDGKIKEYHGHWTIERLKIWPVWANQRMENISEALRRIPIKEVNLLKECGKEYKIK